MIVIILLVGGIITLLIISHNSNSSNNTYYDRKPETNSNLRKVNGVTIYVSDEELKDQAQIIKDNFTNKKESLRNRIKNDMELTDDYIRKKVLNELLIIPIFTESDYERVRFMYNNGQLRTNEEVHKFDLSKTYKTRQHAYDRSRHKTNTIAFWAPFLITLVVFCIIFSDIMFFPVALLFALIAGFIGMMIGYKININDAETYELSADDPSVVDEKHKFTSSVIGGAVAAGFMIHNTKKAVKDVTNVDSWKEMN